MASSSLTVYGTKLSGHTHRVELLLHLLKLPYRFVDAPAPVRQGAEFLRINPLGQIPVLQDGALVLTDSNAILVYLAKRYAPDSSWLPEDPVGAAQVQRWLSLAAGEIAFGPAKARVGARWGDTGMPPALMHKLADKVLGFMEASLAQQDFLAAPQPTLADLACYAYIAHAPEGGIALEAYPQVRSWIARVQALPHFVPMPEH
jgi:glutathione S-transferase